jgi:hypothetical protein
MQHYPAQLGSWVTVVQGLIFGFCVLLFRRGIVGFVADRRNPPNLSPEASATGKKSVARTSLVIATLLLSARPSFAADPAHWLDAVVRVRAEIPPEAQPRVFSARNVRVRGC